MTLPLKIRGYHPDVDLHFVTNSWLESYRTAPATKAVRNELYYPFQEPLCKHLLENSTTLVACDADPKHSHIVYGWACGVHLDGVLVLHYVYIKRSWRRWGIARRLVEALQQGASPDLVLHTHLTYTGREICYKRKGWLYHPYLIPMRFSPWSKDGPAEGQAGGGRGSSPPQGP